ncbi:MAG: hypothetical protein KDD60_06155 [Bdellovibrionales bacterium]|nr:hypothetical protein [Bdellovibrionales bacterium]
MSITERKPLTSLFCASFFALFSFLATPVLCEPRLLKPVGVRAYYDASSQKVIVRWKEVPGALQYQITIRDGDGFQKRRIKSTNIRKKISSSGLAAGATYRIAVKGLDIRGEASPLATVSYVHERSRRSGDGKLLTRNSADRTGAYFLPKGFAKKPKPLMVGFHGQDGAGRSIVGAFERLAKEFGFIIVAPSSRYTPEGIAAWEIGTEPEDPFTEDYFHTDSCMNEVFGFEGVTIDTSHILAIGYSAGGAVAPYFATNREEFTHFAVLHGGTVLGSLGENVVPGWYSTGTNDTLRTPTELQLYVNALSKLGYDDLRFTEYDTDHGLIDKELRQVVEWWLED